MKPKKIPNNQINLDKGKQSLVVLYFLISNYYKVIEQKVSDLWCFDLGFF